MNYISEFIAQTTFLKLIRKSLLFHFSCAYFSMKKRSFWHCLFMFFRKSLSHQMCCANAKLQVLKERGKTPMNNQTLEIWWWTLKYISETLLKLPFWSSLEKCYCFIIHALISQWKRGFRGIVYVLLKEFKSPCVLWKWQSYRC